MALKVMENVGLLPLATEWLVISRGKLGSLFKDKDSAYLTTDKSFLFSYESLLEHF